MDRNNFTDKNLIKTYRTIVIITMLVLAGGIVFYHFVEDLSWLDAYYYCVVTLTTVGYGDITPKTAIGKLFTTVYLLVGIGIITTFISVSVKRRTILYKQRHPKKSR